MMEICISYDTETTKLKNLQLNLLEEWHTQNLVKSMQLEMQITSPMARLRYITGIKFAGLFVSY